jgi:hypothetical protein
MWCLTNRTRQILALAVCLTSATVAVYFVVHGKSRAWTTFDLGIVWMYTGDWLGRRLHLLGLPIGKIHDEARAGSLLPTGTSRTMVIGGYLLLAASLVIALIE